MKTIEIFNNLEIGKATLTAHTAQLKKYIYKSATGDKINNVDVKRTNKGIYISICLAPYNKVITQFISNAHLRFRE